MIDKIWCKNKLLFWQLIGFGVHVKEIVKFCKLIKYYLLIMSYPWFGTGSDFNYCFMYMSELTNCHQNKLYPKTRCQNELEDFI